MTPSAIADPPATDLNRKSAASCCALGTIMAAAHGGSMSLQNLSALASIISALAIVASVVYASLEIRQNTRAVRASAFQEVVNSFAEISFEIAKQRELVELYLHAARAYQSLPEVKQAQYSLMLLSFLRRAENVLFQANTHLLM